jgi:hypothetical protein
MISFTIHGCRGTQDMSGTGTGTTQTDSVAVLTDSVVTDPLIPRSQIIEWSIMGGSGAEECQLIGSVQDLSSRTTIDSAVVSIDDGVISTITANGRFMLTGIPYGDHELHVHKQGYLSLTEPIHLGPGMQAGAVIGLAVPAGN